MEPALDVINRALQGDSGARSFLERTSSIYVLDVNDTANPKTYGCWNFIHQAMNEVERYEAAAGGGGANNSNGGKNGSSRSGDLVGHARILASMALRVARRSPSVDKALVATCVANASQQNFHGPERESQAQWLVDLNLELREIVMGRIAAMAFDFSFHRQQQSTASTTGTTTTASSSMNTSAFADRVVMDMFCSVLAANAVSSGPSAVGPFVTEWIIPSSRTLPSFAVVSVVSHLASEGLRKSAPYGTKDLLQQLSLPVMNIVLVPALKEAVSGNETNEAVNGCMSRERSTQLASVTLNAIRMWCEATDLSLPQMKHLCSKVNVSIEWFRPKIGRIGYMLGYTNDHSSFWKSRRQVNVIEVISDAMYSDSQQIIESLADLIESTVQFSDDLVMSPGRMSQVRHILQVDESSFQAQFTPQQLKTIESHEMASIVDELVSAVGLQRFRFTERQINGKWIVYVRSHHARHSTQL